MNYTQSFKPSKKMRTKWSEAFTDPLHELYQGPSVPAVTDRPTRAGEWTWRPEPGPNRLHIDLQRWFNLPWSHRSDNPFQFSYVIVIETPAAGRLCRELRMGGSIHCGLAPWSGQWRKAG